uniref:LAGLIDADG_2 domain-containing protein n=1 Tax=Heterorhabditis bacteriophora TaxID=37862 RepID=A0A1I7WLV3_HETBA
MIAYIDAGCSFTANAISLIMYLFTFALIRSSFRKHVSKKGIKCLSRIACNHDTYYITQDKCVDNFMSYFKYVSAYGYVISDPALEPFFKLFDYKRNFIGDHNLILPVKVSFVL